MREYKKFLTVDEALSLRIRTDVGREQLEQLAKDERPCMSCGLHVWRFAGCELCFTCTTGESDPSDDYEIGEFYLLDVPVHKTQDAS